MFLFREYAVCLFLALILAGLVVAVGGTGYLLKVTGTMAWQALQAHNARKVIGTGITSIVMANPTS